jgi:hypothetical protein
MENIKDEFLAAFKKTLPRMIDTDTSGDYRRALIALIGN